MKKRTIMAIIASFLIISNTMVTLAAEKDISTLLCYNDNIEQVTYEEQFGNFMSRAMGHEESLYVFSRDGKDVTEEFKNIYAVKGIKEAHRFVQKKECSLRFQVVEENEKNSRATIKSKNVYEYFYECVTCTDGTYTKEWDMELRGIYSYNADTKEITSVRPPTLSIRVAEFGAYWSAYMTGVITDYSIVSKNTVKFSAKYHMYGSFAPYTGVTVTKDFKSHSISFTSSV